MNSLLREIQDLYLNDTRPFYVGFSGGKDSTVVLSLVSRAIRELPIEKRTKPVYVLFSDTLMEMPPVIGQIHNSIERFKQYVKANDLPFEFHKVEPEFKNRFWNQVIGRGATLPRTDLRWCTDRLKITPMEAKVEQVLKKHSGYIALTGARKDESEDRKARLERNSVSPGSKLKVHADSRCNLFCVIEDWTVDQVWSYIYTEAESWVDANALGVVYSEAAGDGDECTTVLEGGEAGQKPGCSKSARYGCWMCPLFNRDKTLGNLSRGHEYLTHMETFRNWLVQYRDGEWHNVRDVYNHGDGFVHLQYSYDNPRFGMTCPGGYSLEFRKEILRRLLETEAKVRETENIRLIEDDELDYIQHCWVKEGDLALTCVDLAAEFGRKVMVSKEDKMIARYGSLLYISKEKWRQRMIFWFGVYPDHRFCAQFIIERFGVYGTGARSLFGESDLNKEIESFLIELACSSDGSYFMASELRNMRMRTQFYPTPALESMIRREWEEDRVSYLTQAQIYDHEQSWPTGAEGDWLEDENIPLADKMAALDNWNYFCEDQRSTKLTHPEYDEFGEKYNTIKFRERVVGSRKSDSPAPMAQPAKQQLSFNFAA